MVLALALAFGTPGASGVVAVGVLLAAEAVGSGLPFSILSVGWVLLGIGDEGLAGLSVPVPSAGAVVEAGGNSSAWLVATVAAALLGVAGGRGLLLCSLVEATAGAMDVTTGAEEEETK